MVLTPLIVVRTRSVGSLRELCPVSVPRISGTNVLRKLSPSIAGPLCPRGQPGLSPAHQRRIRPVNVLTMLEGERPGGVRTDVLW